ncbi:MAG TPA: hypothetical protein VGR95_17785 [Thermoanaerobaculia bacterium]|jgi:hypothetical protein|nr:hypothetical protein [Thermoanaerobaculia bacterium]
MKRYALCVMRYGVLLLAVACASRPPVTAPDLKSVPAIAIEAACTKLRNEGLSGESTLVVKKTEPSLITGASLRSVAHSYAKDLDASAYAATIGSMVQSTPLDFRSTSCKWQTIDKLDPVAQAQMAVVEFSPPFINPFTKGESGILVRMSVGGHDSQWYWIPLAERQGLLGIGLVVPLDLQD